MTCLILAALLLLPGSALAFTPPAVTQTPAQTNTALTVPPKAIAAGNAYWAKLGVTPPKGGFILAHPWSPPWSGRSLIVPVQWFKQAYAKADKHVKDKTPMMVSATDMRADLPILHMALEKNYSGWEPAIKHGWNWDKWFRQWNAMLVSHGHKKIPASEAFAPWFAYEHFQIDSHSGPEIPARFDNGITSRSAMLGSAPHTVCTSLETTNGKSHPLNPNDLAQQPHAVELWTGKALQTAHYLVYPSSLGTAKSLVCGKQHIVLTPFWNAYKRFSKPATALKQSVAALAGGKKGLAIYNMPAPGIGYLRLAQFNDAGDDALVKLLPKLPKSAGHEKLLIVDLRGNDGGGAPLTLLSRWIPVKKIDTQSTQIGKRSCLYPGLWFNLGQVLSIGLKHPTKSIVRELQAAYARGIGAPPTSSCKVHFKTTTGHWHYIDHHFVRHWHGGYPRLLVLVNNRCASDCEGMVWDLAQLPGTVIAGENTFGVTGFTQPGFLLLPHTHIVFQLATSRSEDYGDDRSVNGYGLDVDVALPTTNAWSAQSILALAKALVKPAS